MEQSLLLAGPGYLPQLSFLPPRWQRIFRDAQRIIPVLASNKTLQNKARAMF